MAEKSEDTTTLRFINRDGGSHELTLDTGKMRELGVTEAGLVIRNGAHYVPIMPRTELVNGRPHSVITFNEIVVLSLDRSDLND